MSPSDKQTLDRKEALTIGAFRALMENGLGGLSFNHVAEHSGMSRQLVRHYFADQDSLMIAVCDYLAELYRGPLIEAASSLSGPERLSTFLDFYFDLLDGVPKPRDDQAYDALMALAGRSDAIKTNLANQYGLLGQVMSHEFKVQFPELDQQSANELSFLFVSLMYGHWKLVASLGYSEDHNRVTRQAIDRLIQSYVDSPSADPEPAKIWSKSQVE